jgi:nitroreductase
VRTVDNSAATVNPAAAAAIHPILAARFSPRRFDPTRALDEESIATLVEAFRWAPSAGNSQPWGLFPARRGEPEHRRIVAHLAPSSARWAPDAAVLFVTAAHRQVEDTDLLYSEFADYDLGQAVAHLTLQAQALGLASHQFRAFDLDALARELRPRPGWHIVSMIAVGHAVEEEPQQRERRSAADVSAAPWT